jgi:predicted transcriptional regulator
MAPAPRPISLRLGHAGLGALEELARARGISKAEAARQAIEEAARRESQQSGLAAEARRLSENSAYVQEAREIVAELEDLRAPW